jgi:gas vesicle protein
MLNDVNYGYYGNHVGSFSNPQPEGGSVGSFFKHLGRKIKKGATNIGNDIKSVAVNQGKQFGNELLNQGKNALSSAIQTGLQHPELATMALTGAGIGLHDRLFEMELDKQLKKHKLGSGIVGGFNFKKMAKDAFNKSKRIASNELNKQISNVKTRVQPDLENLKNKLVRKATDYADSNYSHLKNKIENSLGVSSSEPVGAGRKKRKPSEKMLKRNALIKTLMHRHGLTMIEASKMIKQKGLM